MPDGSYTNYPNGISSFGVPVIPGLPLPTTGNVFFVDAVRGSNAYPGSASQPFASIYKAYDACVAGHNDIVVIVGDGAATGTQRLSLANAQAITPAATAGTLTWAKNATHLIGMTAPTINARARFAPPTGTYTMATFGSGNFVNVTAAGCIFANFSLFNGFSTGGANQICWTDSGGRNLYHNVSFGGAADAASAQATTSRSMKITGTGENKFVGCYFGVDTVTKTVANATLEFAGGTPRNTFIDCVFPFQTSAATPLGIIVTGAAAMDRWQLFERCKFINNIGSTSTAMDVLASVTDAAPGGVLIFKDCTLVGITEFADTIGLTVTYIDGGTVTAATSGIAVNPT